MVGSAAPLLCYCTCLPSEAATVTRILVAVFPRVGGPDVLERVGDHEWSWRVGSGFRQKLHAAMEHGGGYTCHDGLCLDMQVAVRLIGLPRADEADAVGINTTPQHGHRIARASGASGYVAAAKSVRWEGSSTSAPRRRMEVRSDGRTNCCHACGAHKCRSRGLWQRRRLVSGAGKGGKPACGLDRGWDGCCGHGPGFHNAPHFFWDVKVRVTGGGKQQVADEEAVLEWWRIHTTPTSWRQKRLFAIVRGRLLYLPGQSKNSYARTRCRQRRQDKTMGWCVEASWWAWRTTDNGRTRGLMRRGRGSGLFQAWKMVWIRKSNAPKEFERGSMAPIQVNVRPAHDGGSVACTILLCKEEKNRNRVVGDVAEVGLDAKGGAKPFPDAPGGGRGIAAMRRLVGLQH